MCGYVVHLGIVVGVGIYFQQVYARREQTAIIALAAPGNLVLAADLGALFAYVPHQAPGQIENADIHLLPARQVLQGEGQDHLIVDAIAIGSE